MPSVFTLEGPPLRDVAIPRRRLQLGGLGLGQGLGRTLGRALASGPDTPPWSTKKTLTVVGGAIAGVAALAYVLFGGVGGGLKGVPVEGDEQLGVKLHEYHYGQNDPVYAVGSQFYSQGSADSTLVHDAADNLEITRARGAKALAKRLRAMANSAERSAGYGRRSRI